MKRERALYVILFLLSASLSFSASAGVDLNSLEKELNSRPDSVLTQLRSISPGQLGGRESKALYSLLLSQALDKTGVDISSDSLIAPAVRYFCKHGGNTDRRLRTLYYRGRIAENAGNADEAMEWFKRGEELVARSSDFATAGQLYSHKSVLYYNIFDYNDALSNARTSSEFFLKASDTLSYSNRKLDMAGIYLLTNNPEAAERSLESLSDFFPSLPQSVKARYFYHRIDAAISRNDKDMVSTLCDECHKVLSDVPAFPSLEMILSKALLFSGKPKESLGALEAYREHDGDFASSPSYLLQLSETHAALGNYEEAFKAYKTNREINRRMAEAALEADTKFVEEKYEAEINELHRKEKLNTIIVTSLLILATMILLIRNLLKALEIVRNELSESEIRYRKLLKEHDALNDIIKHATQVDEETIALLNERRRVIESVLIGYISSDPNLSREAERGIEKLLDDKDDFIASNSKLFAVRYPRLYKHLLSCGLDQNEIGYCSLNMIGLQTKDLDKMFGIRGRKSLSAGVRAKLGIPKEDKVRLKTFLSEKEKALLDDQNAEEGENNMLLTA